MYNLLNNNQKILSIVIIALLLLLSACSDPDTDNTKQAKIHLKTSQSYFEQGQYRAAMIEARNVIKYSPKAPDGYILLANIYKKIGNSTAAIKILEPLEETHSNEISLPLAEAYLLSRKYVSAQKQLVNTSDKQSEEYLILKGKIASRLKKYDEAITMFNTVIGKKPGNVEAKISIIRTEFMRGNTAIANKAIDELIVNAPQDPEVLFLNAQTAYSANNLDQAESFLTDALTYLPESDIITPLKSNILRSLSTTLTQLGRTSEAFIYNKLLAEANPEAHKARKQFEEAISFYQTGNIEEAEKLLLSLHEKYPDNNVSGTLLGMINYQRGDLSEASSFLEENVDPETASTKVISSTALTQLQLQQPKKALVILEQALATRPEDPDLNAIYGLALLAIDAKDKNGAISLQKALAIDPSRSKLHLILARHYLALENIEQAYAQYTTGLEKTPSDQELQKNYITTLLQNKKIQKALKLAAQFIDENPNSPQAYIQAARVNIFTKNLAAAKQQLQKAVSLDKDNAIALTTLGQLQMSEQKWQQAESNFRNAISVNANINAYKGLITSFEARQQREKIINELSAIADSENGNPILLAVLAEYNARQSKLPIAEQYADKAIIFKPIHNYVRSTALKIYRISYKQSFAEKQLPLARKKLSKALALEPDSLLLLNDMVTIEIASDNHQEAFKIAEKINEMPGQEILANYIKGIIYADQEKWPKAIKNLQNAWNAQPSDNIAATLYQSLLSNKMEDKAAALVQEWRKKLPQSTQPLIIEATRKQQQGQTDEAIALYKQSLEIAPNSAMALNNLAWLYFERGNTKASKIAEKAYQLAPQNAAIMDTYGWILVNTGETTRGIELLEEAVQLAPNMQEISDHLRQALEREPTL